MTRPDLDAIEARAKAATPGPWRSEPGFCGSQQRKFLRRESGMDGVLFGRHCVKAEEAQYDLDCDFTASARTDVPELIVYVRELEAQNAALKEALIKAAVPLEVLAGQIANYPYTEITEGLQEEIVDDIIPAVRRALGRTIFNELTR
jgi:hypothetical protein